MGGGGHSCGGGGGGGGGESVGRCAREEASGPQCLQTALLPLLEPGGAANLTLK